MCYDVGMDDMTNSNITDNDNDEFLEKMKCNLSAGLSYEVGNLKRSYTEKALTAQLSGRQDEASEMFDAIDALEALVDRFNDKVLVRTSTEDQLRGAVENFGLPSEFRPHNFYDVYAE